MRLILLLRATVVTVGGQLLEIKARAEAAFAPPAADS
jgi:hypothetical protein